MTDHPAIVALAKARYGRDCNTDANGKIVPWDELPDWLRDELIDLSALDYAAVLRDLMEPSEAMKTAWSTCPSRAPQARHEAMLRARAREIGVGVE